VLAAPCEWCKQRRCVCMLRLMGSSCLLAAELGSLSAPLHSLPSQALHMAARMLLVPHTPGQYQCLAYTLSKAWVFHARCCCHAAHVERLLSWLIHGFFLLILYHRLGSLSRPTLDAGRLNSPAWLPATAALISIIERGNTRGVTCLSGVHLRCLLMQQGLDSYLRNIQ
jgi:hypothetical protein